VKPPIETILREALKDFDKYLQHKGDKPATVEHRHRGAEQFIEFLLGREHAKGERIKGTN